MSAASRVPAVLAILGRVASSALAAWALLRLGLGGPASIGLAAILPIAGTIECRVGRRSARRPGPAVGINLGGGIVPLALASWFAAGLPARDRPAAAIGSVVVAAIGFCVARPAIGVGLVAPWALPALAAAAVGLVGADRSARAAFVVAVVGSFLGIDVLRSRTLGARGPSRAVVGGGGASDGLLWTGLLAGWLAGGG